MVIVGNGAQDLLCAVPAAQLRLQHRVEGGNCHPRAPVAAPGVPRSLQDVSQVDKWGKNTIINPWCFLGTRFLVNFEVSIIRSVPSSGAHFPVLQECWGFTSCILEKS